MTYEKQLLDYLEKFDGEKFDSQEIKEAYEFFNLIISQIEIDSALKYSDANDRKTFQHYSLQLAFESFFVRVLMNKKLVRNNANYIISQINNML